MRQQSTASGYDGVITWSLPDTTGVVGQQVLMRNNGTSTDCSSVNYGTTVATGLAPTVTAYTDADRTASAGAGRQFCYAVETYWSTDSWTMLARAPATQLGLAVESVDIENGRTAVTLDRDDTITLTFNQQPQTPSDASVCQYVNGGVILIGDSTCVAKGTDPWGIARLAGYTISGTGKQLRSATVAVSRSPPWTMTVTIGQNGRNVSGSATFTPSTSLLSVGGANQQASACTSANCKPTPTGAF